MDWGTLGVGFAGGLLAHALHKVIDDSYIKWKYPLRREGAELLLQVAFVAEGHLQFKKDTTIQGPPLLWMKDWPWEVKNLPRFEDTGQTTALLARGLVQQDPERGHGFFILTGEGWLKAKKLPRLRKEYDVNGGGAEIGCETWSELGSSKLALSGLRQ